MSDRRERVGREVEIKLVDNPRSDETLVEAFAVDTTKARDRLGWEPEHTVDASVRELLRTRADTVRA
jgi:UDP-glucose 4-epimerase